jgi:hypothetical protein
VFWNGGLRLFWLVRVAGKVCYGGSRWLGFRKGMNVLEHSSQFLEFCEV